MLRTYCRHKHSSSVGAHNADIIYTSKGHNRAFSCRARSLPVHEITLDSFLETFMMAAGGLFHPLIIVLESSFEEESHSLRSQEVLPSSFPSRAKVPSLPLLCCCARPTQSGNGVPDLWHMSATPGGGSAVARREQCRGRT